MDIDNIRIIKEIASPDGAMAYDAHDHASMPVEGDDTGLTYGAYFEALEAFVSGEGFAPLMRALVASGRPEGLAEAKAVVLRAEKHGALYHPASCTVRFDGDAAKFCLNVAASEMGRGCLEVEAGLLETLRGRFTPEFLPCPYAYGKVGALGLLLEEWFGGYHEFHQDGSGRVRLWDFDAGERLLTAGEAAALYGEAARILTRYYDTETGASIGPWHHGAGDFVARIADGAVSARLITVRGYGASRPFTEAGPMAERLAGLSFFANMTMRARLDRVNGVGDLVLADTAVVPSIVAGFATALGERPDSGDAGLGLLDFLGSFSAEELAGAGAQLMETCPPEERELLAVAWPEHAEALVAGLGGL
ncbi:conserved hypothetical protein [Solidesulfovibrio fructosivorans JJ]]|uniref:Uncharacterized protein n=1 Tax=Solidesulfovibrio fructosivorans JJ] TaxID=596151 RepID=E1K131_SOLFR|nr:hypothetical protein [Solidesulfovibrio fructosivorans]EFL49658.1 conserved hypothetical protein [Solidesulfovibrio fructosivorans JJ]]